MPINFSEIFTEKEQLDATILSGSHLADSDDHQYEFAVWSTAYINSLPDSSFLYIAPDGSRHLPYKDKTGKIDLPHLRNAAARVNQVSGIPASTVDAIKSRIAKMLGAKGMSELLEIDAESKEWEHSDPGTGTPPAPRTDEDGSDDPAIRGGWRRETPPIVTELEDSVTPKGGDKLPPFDIPEKDAHELLRVLDLPVDADGVKVVEKAKLMFGELHELKLHQDATEQEKQFAEKYPQYWEQHNLLMKRDRENSARAFSESVQKIRKTEGYGLKDTKQGLSTMALEKLQEVHRKFAEKTVTVDDFEDCIKTIVNGGIVQFGELGSNGDDDSVPEIDTSSATGVAAGRKLFAEVVQKVQKEHEDWDYMKCMEEAAKKHPDLAEAYKVTLPA